MSLDYLDTIRTILKSAKAMAVSLDCAHEPAQRLARCVLETPDLPLSCAACGGVIYHAPTCTEEEDQGLTVAERQHRAKLRAITPGSVWRHYKGGVYVVIGRLKHTETLEELVAYVPLGTPFADAEIGWARPSEMWVEGVDVVLEDGEPYLGDRFRLVPAREIKRALEHWGG